MSLKGEIRKTVEDYLETHRVAQARLARLAGLSVGTLNDLVHNGTPALATVVRLDRFFQKQDLWVNAFIEHARRAPRGKRTEEVQA
jgi:hypothetical protein